MIRLEDCNVEMVKFSCRVSFFTREANKPVSAVRTVSSLLADSSHPVFSDCILFTFFQFGIE